MAEHERLAPIEHPKALENVSEQLEQRSTIQGRQNTVRQTSMPTPRISSPPREQKSALRDDIELALADDKLKTLYAALDPQVQQVFSATAGRLALRLETMIKSGQIDIKEAHEEIERWVHIIPNLDRWFLTQEAKVKTDNILSLARKTQGENI